MSFSGSLLSGTPTQTGSFPITVTATDSNGCTGSRGYTLVINCPTITVNPASLSAGNAGVAYASVTFTQTGVPSEFYKEISTGWRSYYWSPLRKTFAKAR